MATKEELYEAAKLLREHCLERETCKACQFATEEDGIYICALRSDSDPESWRLRKPSRWTEADVLMAKAMHKYGWLAVRKTSLHNNPQVLFVCENGTNEYAPHGSFKNLAPGEQCKFEDIIKEAEDGENSGI